MLFNNTLALSDQKIHYHSCIIKMITSIAYKCRRMIFIDHFCFFSIITNSPHPASNYLWIGVFFSFLDTRESFNCQLCVWFVSAWLLTPIFLHFKLCVCIYIDCCLLSEMYVCACSPTPFSAGKQELLWRPKNEPCFRGSIFHYTFVSPFLFLFFFSM